MAYSMADLAKVLKRIYNQGPIADTTLSDFPFYGKVKKVNDFAGEYKVYPIKYAHHSGRSMTFSSALLNKGNPKYDRWLIDVNHDYAMASVPREAILRTTGKGAFLKEFTNSVDDQLAVLRQSLAWQLYRDGTGVRGQLLASGSGYASATITLTTSTDMNAFEVGMVLTRKNSTAEDPTVGSGSAGALVTAVDRLNRTLTTTSGSANWGTAINAVDGSELVQQGDLNACVKGLNAWLLTASSATSFFGVDRSADQRLWGLYRAASGLLIEQQLKYACADAIAAGGNPDSIFMHPEDFTALEISLLGAGLARYDVSKSSDGLYGFKGLVFPHGRGAAMVMADPMCPKSTAYVLDLATWELCFMGPAGPHLIDTDGQLIRDSSADSYDIRCGYWAQLVCKAPGLNVRVAL